MKAAAVEQVKQSGQSEHHHLHRAATGARDRRGEKFFKAERLPATAMIPSTIPDCGSRGHAGRGAPD